MVIDRSLPCSPRTGPPATLGPSLLPILAVGVTAILVTMIILNRDRHDRWLNPTDRHWRPGVLVRGDD